MPQWARDWQRKLFDNGWLVPGWPPELGGRNACPTEQMIYFEEVNRREIWRSANPQGLGIIAPSINDYGTDEQKERFLLPTLRAEISWCLGMSEPNAGSDLASLRTRAELIGDEFVVNGQKVWTSGAHHADWCLCFVRTDPDAPKHKGISALIIDTTVAGRRAPAVPGAERPRVLRLQRGLLQRRAGPEGAPRRAAARWLADHAGFARPRTGDAVDRLRLRRAARRSMRSSRSAITRQSTARASATTIVSATRSPASTSTRRRCSRWATAGSRSSCTASRRPSTRC